MYTATTIAAQIKFDIQVDGDDDAPPLIYRHADDENFEIIVQSAHIEFDSDENGYAASAWIRGPRVLKGRRISHKPTDVYCGTGPLWPDWLTSLAESLRPTGPLPVTNYSWSSRPILPSAPASSETGVGTASTSRRD